MLERSDIDTAADVLLGAYSSGVPSRPLTERYDALTVEDAYAIQSAQLESWRRGGREVCGYKVGLTSKAMQEQLGVDQPDYGFLLDGMYYDNGATVDASAFIAPKVEPEIAVYLGRALRGPGLTIDEVADAVESVVGSLELIDSRIADWRITLADTIADNASSAGVVAGTVTAPLAEVDVVALPVTLTINGEVVGAGDGSAVMGSPLNAVLWLANKLGELGVELQPGALVLPGSVCAAVAVSNGDSVLADFGPLGTVGIDFAAKE